MSVPIETREAEPISLALNARNLSFNPNTEKPASDAPGRELAQRATPSIVGEETLRNYGSFRRVRQYLQGYYPGLGILHQGWSGPETIVTRDIITPLAKFQSHS